jgi:hypothetical protein
MSVHDRFPATLPLMLLAVAWLALAVGLADPVAPEPVTCPRVAAEPLVRDDRNVQLHGSVPVAFATGQRVTLCGSRLFNTYQANPPSAVPDARMLRIGDWYLPIDSVVVSNGGERLSFTVASGGPYRRLPGASAPAAEAPVTSGGAPRRYVFVAEPVTGGTIAGPIALHSLSSPPDSRRQHSTDVVALTPSVWRASAIQRRETR